MPHAFSENFINPPIKLDNVFVGDDVLGVPVSVGGDVLGAPPGSASVMEINKCT